MGSRCHAVSGAVRGLGAHRCPVLDVRVRSLADTYLHTLMLDYGRHAHDEGAITGEESALWQSRLEALDQAGEFAATITVRADVLRVPRP